MIIEHRGYEISQGNNHHIMIVKDGKMRMHAQCNKPMTEDELRQRIDRYIAFTESKNFEELWKEE